MEGRVRVGEGGGGRGRKKTKITKACACLSLVFSTPLHKIPPSVLSIPSSLSPSAPPSSLSLVSRSPPRSHKLALASSKWLRVHWRERGEGSGPASISHFRAEEFGDDRQPLSWTLTGLTAGTHPSSLYPTTLRLQHELLVGQPSQQTPALWVTLPTSKHFPGTHL